MTQALRENDGCALVKFKCQSRARVHSEIHSQTRLDLLPTNGIPTGIFLVVDYKYVASLVRVRA